MKNLKKIIACVMAVATLGSITLLPTISASANQDIMVNASANQDIMVNASSNQEDYWSNYYKKLAYQGKTAFICTNFDNQIVKYYHDDTTDGIVENNDIDLSSVDNIVILVSKETLQENNVDLSQYNNVEYLDTSSNDYISHRFCIYNTPTNEYLSYWYDENYPIKIETYNPKMISTSDDDMQYVDETFRNYSNDYLQSIGIDDNIKFSAMFNNDTDFLYYKDNTYLASFSDGINCSLYFESANTNLTVDDILTQEQKDYISKLYKESPVDSGDYNFDKLYNKGLNEKTGLTQYYFYFYIPYGENGLSYMDTVEYRYNIGKSLIENGTVQNAYFMGSSGYDDYNNISVISTDIAIIMKDNSEPTKETFGEYSNIIQSIEKVSCEDGSTLDGETSYYKITLINENASYDASQIVLNLKKNQDVQYVGALNSNYESTCLGCLEKNIGYRIPIIADTTTIGDSEDITIGNSEKQYPRGDVNQDGKTNSLDLLVLKKYLLGLIEW